MSAPKTSPGWQTASSPNGNGPDSLNDEKPTVRDQYPGGRKQQAREGIICSPPPDPHDQYSDRIQQIRAEMEDLDSKSPEYTQLAIEMQDLMGQRMIDSGEWVSTYERLQTLSRLEAGQWARAHLATRELDLPEPVDFNDLVDEDADYLVGGYLQLGTVGFLCGKYGTAKSFLVLDWTCCVATGRDWLGHETKMGNVIYIAAEGAGGQSKRADAWVQVNEPVPAGIVTLLKKPIQLGNSQHVDYLVELTAKQRASLVIIDTLARSMVGLDESKDGAIITAALDQIRDSWGERQTTVLVVHHFGKDEKRGARGDSRFISDADFNFTMEKDANGCIILHCDKMKDDEVPADAGLRLRKVQLDKWGKRTSCVLHQVELADDDDQVVDYIRDNPHLGTGAIVEARGGNRSNMSTRLARLQREGRIHDEDKRQNRNDWVVTDSEHAVTVAHNSK